MDWQSLIFGVLGGLLVGLIIGLLVFARRAARGVAADTAQRPSAESLRLLALLQREGRLVDFLMEDIPASTPDAQIGAAVREVHRACQKALRDHLVLEKVIPQEEETTVTVPVGFDPSAIRLTGNVTGQPPFQGTLKHAGWRVREIKLAPPPAGQDPFILMPAEVAL
jgi:hypothetical protein